MTDNAIPFSDEITHLAEVNKKLDDGLCEADAGVSQIDKEYRDFKRYMVQNRGELDPHEVFQNELALTRVDRAGAFAVSRRDKIAKLKDSPYFARIDFREDDDSEAEAFYIGRFSYSHKHELLVLDWRAPIAGMFYDCEVGPASYDAPAGRIRGELTRKRQFKILRGEMEYALESSVNIQDDVLQRELSSTSDEKMKSIISTIQKEQNQIIRNEKSKTLIIQGVAGSGKTSIALHRIAFLLYRFKDRLSARNVTILSPNKVFADYISSVLPELGEEPIYEMSFADIAEVQLEGVIDFAPDKDPLETDDEKWAARARFKSTFAFVEQMDEYIRQMPEQVFEPADYTVGRFTATADWIRERYGVYKKYPVMHRLQKIADDIYVRFDLDNRMEDTIPKAKIIVKSIIAMLKATDTLSLYKDFYRQAGVPEMFAQPAKKTLEWADVYPFLYLHAAFEGLRGSGVIKHLVIDEMQDYTPIQYAVINRLFTCPKTILGDFGQFVNPHHLNTMADMKQLYREADIIELKTSYRSTYEIIAFARGIQHVDMEAIERHGDSPEILTCKDTQDEIEQIKAGIDTFLQEAKYASLGVIMKTNHAAQALYDLLAKDYELELISPESTRFTNGVSVTSIRMSKGLEFDAVIIPGANNETYTTEYDRSLLYIACTRAMHRLTLLHTGERSRLIGSVSSLRATKKAAQPLF